MWKSKTIWILIAVAFVVLALDAFGVNGSFFMGKKIIFNPNVVGAIIGGLIPGVITWKAVHSVDEQAAKRYKNEVFYRKYCEEIIELESDIKELLSLNIKLENYLEGKYSSEEDFDFYDKINDLHSINAIIIDKLEMLKNRHEVKNNENYSKIILFVNKHFDFLNYLKKNCDFVYRDREMHKNIDFLITLFNSVIKDIITAEDIAEASCPGLYSEDLPDDVKKRYRFTNLNMAMRHKYQKIDIKDIFKFKPQ